MEMDPLAAVLPQYALEEPLAEHEARDEAKESAATAVQPPAAGDGVASEAQERKIQQNP